jgi:hypothetical protein
MHIGAQRVEYLVLDLQVSAAFQNGRGSRCRGEADRIELAPCDSGDQLVEVSAQWG